MDEHFWVLEAKKLLFILANCICVHEKIHCHKITDHFHGTKHLFTGISQEMQIFVLSLCGTTKSVIYCNILSINLININCVTNI